MTEQERQDRTVAFAIFRVTLGFNIFLHGFVRIWAGVDSFVATMAPGFRDTLLPEVLVIASLWVIPWLEALIGAALILGFQTRLSLIAGSLLMTLLVTGTALKSDWSALGIQMVYVLCYYLLTCRARFDGWGIDALTRGQTATQDSHSKKEGHHE